ncbi:MAG: hypothetical protein K2J20_06005 [Bacilli bacterium]|nr:hypothetical protein [Bacilli bacterium]
MKPTKLNNIIFHIRYPYAALIIAIMWIGMAIIIVNQENPQTETLIIATCICTLIIAFTGFKSPKQ